MGRAFFMVVISPVVRWIAHHFLTNLRIRVGVPEVAEALGKRRYVSRSCGPIDALRASRLMVSVWLRLGGKCRCAGAQTQSENRVIGRLRRLTKSAAWRPRRARRA